MRGACGVVAVRRLVTTGDLRVAIAFVLGALIGSALLQVVEALR